MHIRGLGRKNGYTDRGMDLMKQNQRFNSINATCQFYLLSPQLCILFVCLFVLFVCLFVLFVCFGGWVGLLTALEVLSLYN